MRRRLAAVTTVGALTAGLALTGPFAATAWSAPPPTGWTSVDLGTLGGAHTHANDVNDKGQVVGMSQTADGTFHAFLWQGGVMTDLTPGLPEDSAAHAINDRGEIAGHLFDPADREPQGVRWFHGTTTVVADLAYAYAINERGRIGGLAEHPAEPPVWWRTPFVWTAGTLVDLGPTPYPEVWESSDLVDLNRSGTVLGLNQSVTDHEITYLWADGTFARLGGDTGRMAGTDLSDRGHVVGQTWGEDGTAATPVAALWRDGTVETLGTLPGDPSSTATALNENDVVVGSSWSDDDDLTTRRAVVWADGAMDVLDPVDDRWGEASEVNDSGQVAGWLGYAGPDGIPVQQAFVWTDGVLTRLGDAHGSVSVDDQNAKGQVLVSSHGSASSRSRLFTPPKRRS